MSFKNDKTILDNCRIMKHPLYLGQLRLMLSPGLHSELGQRGAAPAFDKLIR